MKTAKHFFVFFLLSSLGFTAFPQDKIDVLILNKKYREAISAIDRQMQNDTTLQLYYKKGQVYSLMQNYSDAGKAFSEALKIDSLNADVLGELAEVLSLQGNQYDAALYYEKAVSLLPSDNGLKAKLGRVYINQKKIKNAYDVFTGIYATDSSNSYWNKQLAYCSFRIGRRMQAVHLYEKVLEENPRDYQTYFNLVNTYSRDKEKKKIAATLEKGLTEFPEDAEMILEKANFLFKTRKYQPAMLEFEHYFTTRGDSIFEILMNYGISTYFAGNETKAMGVFDKLFQANPNDAFVMYYKSLCYKKMNNLAESEKFMRWAIDASYPGYLSEMYHHLGQICGLQRKFPESIEALKKSNELDPENVEALFEIATTYEEFNANKTLALNYYNIYLKEAGENGDNISYALNRISKIKEELFFEE